jgi:uncharacterized membrane protein
MISGAVHDRVSAAFKGDGMELIKSNLSQEQESKAREEFDA